jgi:nicotinamidase-related amidase
MADVNEYLYEQGRNVVVPALQRLVLFFRKHGLRVIWTTCSSELDDGSDLIPVLKSANAASRERGCEWFIPPKSSEWARFVSTIESVSGELVINKTSYSAFAGTGLEQKLHNMDVTTLVIGGLVTNFCVETTARDGVDMGFQVILVNDACACRSPEMQAATMLTFGGSQGRVRQADEVITLLEQSLW